MYYYVKRISVRSVGVYTFLIVFIVMFVLTLLLWPLYYAVFKMMPVDSTIAAGAFNPAALFAEPVLMIILPILCALFAAMVGIIMAIVYNLLSIRMKGIKIHLVRIEENK